MKPTGFLKWMLPAALPLWLAACAVGPNYHTPAAPAVASYVSGTLPAATAKANGIAQNFVPGQDIAGDWWAVFHSPELDSLIDTALANNPTLTAAQQTLIEAQEDVRAEQGSYLPSLSGSFQDERERISSAELANTGAVGAASSGDTIIKPFTIYDASLSATYSLDVFGGVRRQVESLQAQADYERFELEASYLTLTSDIVSAAVTDASLRAQIAATGQIVATEQSQLSILQKQFNLGGVPMANVISQQANLASAEATLPPLESQLAQTRNQLADLVGTYPADFDEADFSLSALNLPANLPLSLPSAVVAQRPDIQAAAAQLHEASANVGVATANMLPQITLSADVGHQALSTGTLFTPQTLVWSLVAGITQPIFEGGALYAKRKASIAALRAAGAQYQVTVLSAFQNVANALQTLQFDADTLAADELAEQTSQHSLAVTQSQYQLGGQPFTAVLTAQTTYQNAVVARVKAQAARYQDTAALFQALGGGWWNRKDVPAAVDSCCGIIP